MENPEEEKAEEVEQVEQVEKQKLSRPRKAALLELGEAFLETLSGEKVGSACITQFLYVPCKKRTTLNSITGFCSASDKPLIHMFVTQTTSELLWVRKVLMCFSTGSGRYRLSLILVWMPSRILVYLLIRYKWNRVCCFMTCGAGIAVIVSETN